MPCSTYYLLLLAVPSSGITTANKPPPSHFFSSSPPYLHSFSSPYHTPHFPGKSTPSSCSLVLWASCSLTVPPTAHSHICILSCNNWLAFYFWPCFYLSIGIVKAKMASVVLFLSMKPYCCSQMSLLVQVWFPQLSARSSFGSTTLFTCSCNNSVHHPSS